MNDQSGTAQLRFLEETAIRLRQNGFTVEPIEDHHLPVRWEKGRLCRVSGKGSVLYRQECVDSVRAQDALQTVIDTAKMTTEYMAILETATLLKAGGLTGDYERTCHEQIYLFHAGGKGAGAEHGSRVSAARPGGTTRALWSGVPHSQ